MMEYDAVWIKRDLIGNEINDKFSIISVGFRGRDSFPEILERRGSVVWGSFCYGRIHRSAKAPLLPSHWEHHQFSSHLQTPSFTFRNNSQLLPLYAFSTLPIHRLIVLPLDVLLVAFIRVKPNFLPLIFFRAKNLAPTSIVKQIPPTVNYQFLRLWE